MRRSPPALSCLTGLDLQRKRPHADLTPEAPEPAAQAAAQAEPPPPGEAAGDMTLAVEETPSFAHTTRGSHNPNETRKR